MLYANSEADGARVSPKPLSDLDWTRLRRQKKWLRIKYDQAQEARDSTGKGASMGLLNLVDSIQEFAVEQLGYPPQVVWGPEVIGDPMREAIDADKEAA